MKFKPGRLTATDDVNEKMQNNDRFYDFVMDSVNRYCACDWGDVSENDRNANTAAVCAGDERILAAYISTELKTKIWILTAADRSVTTVMFPYEY